MAFTGLREAGLTKARIEALTDGIFATVMTVLILGLRPPTIDLSSPGASLSNELSKLTPNILTYALSFITLGIYWIGHHNQFHYVRRTDRALLWINIVFLMSVGFIPFTTSVLGAYPSSPAAVRAYGPILSRAALVCTASGGMQPLVVGWLTATFLRAQSDSPRKEF